MNRTGMRCDGVGDAEGRRRCVKCGEEKPLGLCTGSGKVLGGSKTICSKCVRIRQKAYYAINREKLLAQRVAYYAAHRERLKAYQITYYDTNLERIQAYRVANKDKLSASQAAYRAAKKEELKGRQTARQETPQSDTRDGWDLTH